VYFVYAIYNRQAKKIYIGQTHDLDKRLKEHNDANNLTHLYTKRIGIGWELVYSESVTDRKQALVREKQLKSFRGREFVKKHIPL